MYLMSLYLASSVDFLPHPTVQNWKDSCKKELDLGDFPWTQIFNARFSGKKVYCSKAYSEQEPFCVLQLLACLAFSLPELILLHLFPWQKDSQYMHLRTPVAPSEHQVQLMGFSSLSWMILCWIQWCQAQGEAQMEPFASFSRGSSGGLWEQLVTSRSWHAQGKQSSTCKALRVPRWAHGCARLLPLWSHLLFLSTLCCFPDFCPRGT